MSEKGVYTVTQLNNYIKMMLDGDPYMNRLTVQGELSNYKMYPSGHHYFTLKDAESSLKCVMFKSSAATLRFRPESGMKVTVSGRISVYPRDGIYQLYVSSMLPDGTGDLQIAFEQLKKKLGEEGLFEEEFKKSLPLFPEKVAVITSGSGAAVHDIIRIMGHRWPYTKILVLPVRVQGAEAPGEIAAAIRYANKYRVADVLIVGRGGGSLEDLWAFNEEIVARAIFASDIPVISAVGHEPDVTISDYVADVRASTPSNAAELVVPERTEVMAELKGIQQSLLKVIRNRIALFRSELAEYAAKPVMTNASVYVANRRMTLDYTADRLLFAYRQNISDYQSRLAEAGGRLDAMSPLKVLGRGYAIVQKNGKSLVDAKNVQIGDCIEINLARGRLDCEVKEIDYGGS